MNSTYENKNETNTDYSGYKHKPRNELTLWRYQDGKYFKNQMTQSINENIIH